MKEQFLVRKACLSDVSQIRSVVNRFADDARMLPLSLNQIYDHLRDFWIVERRGRVIGCGALKIVWKDLGEIRSLAIIQRHQKKGLGIAITEKILDEARAMGIKKLFLLTYAPGFFKKLGFVVVPKAKLPHKIWLDCINCPKFPRCDEIALIKYIP
jgi:amino-acid N-acetyltransferase